MDDERILRILQGRAPESEEQNLQAWLDAALENREHFEELRSIWILAERTSPALRSVRRPRAIDLVRDESGRDPAGQRWVAPVPRRRMSRILAPLAAAAAIAGVAVGINLLISTLREPVLSFGAAEFSTGPRETVTVRLEDGTIVRLGPSSALQMDGTDGERNVWLDGQAFFAVAHHDDDAPFHVRSRAGTATVLGTRFDVRARDDDLRLVVVDGRVRVAAGPEGQQTREVGPSEMSQVVAGGRVYVSQVPDVYALLEWMEGSLIFQSTPLERVAVELEHHYGITADVVDPELASRTITAWFTDEPLEATVTVICRAADVRCEVTESGVRIGL